MHELDSSAVLSSETAVGKLCENVDQEHNIWCIVVPILDNQMECIGFPDFLADGLAHSNVF